MKTPEIHNEILDHLLDKGIYFKPRKINRGKRLEQGYWFLGNENYLNIGFWSGKDWYRKINNIGFAIDFNKRKDVFLCLSARQDYEASKHLENIAQIVGANKVGNSIDLWIKLYSTGKSNIDEYKNRIDEFINNDRILIDKYIAENETPFNKISSIDFQKSIERIFKYKEGDYKSTIDLDISKVNKTFKKGKNDLNLENQLRIILNRKLVIEPVHRKLQIKLKEELKELENVEVVFEENNIDVKVVYEEEIHLYEVKTSNSPITCIKQGLGQLLFYLSQNFYENVTKIFIAGPEEPNDNDFEFIFFLKETLQVKFEYIQISK